MSDLYTQYKEPKTREELIQFLTNHFRYYTMNSWNLSTSYANLVKLHHLELTSEQFTKAAELLFDEELDTSEYQFMQSQLFAEFTKKTGYAAGFNGRSSGYVVLYDTKITYKDNEPQINICTGRSIDLNEDFSEWGLKKLQERYNLVHEFDTLCNKLRDLLIDYIDNGTIETEEYTVVKVQRTLTLPERTEETC